MKTPNKDEHYRALENWKATCLTLKGNKFTAKIGNGLKRYLKQSKWRYLLRSKDTAKQKMKKTLKTSVCIFENIAREIPNRKYHMH